MWICVTERTDRPGKYRVIYEVSGERGSRSFGSQAEAEAFRAALEAEAARQAQTPEDHSLLSVAERFLAAKKAEGLQPNTLDTYRALLLGAGKEDSQGVVWRLGSSKHPAELRTADVESYRDQRQQEVSATTVARELDRLCALLGWAVSKGVVPTNVAEPVTPPKIQEQPKDWLRSTEIGPFLDVCTEAFHPVAQFTIFTGLRRAEIITLQRSDVDLRNGVIQIRSKPHLGFRPKSGKERSVPIDPTLRPVLERRLQSINPGLDAFVFAKANGQRRALKTRWFCVKTAEAAKRAGVDRPLTFHDLRRTYGAMLIESGVGIYEVSRLLGHADVRITQKVYAPICGRFLAQEASKLGRYLGHSLIREIKGGKVVGM